MFARLFPPVSLQALKIDGWGGAYDRFIMTHPNQYAD